MATSHDLNSQEAVSFPFFFSALCSLQVSSYRKTRRRPGGSAFIAAMSCTLQKLYVQYAAEGLLYVNKQPVFPYIQYVQ